MKKPIFGSFMGRFPSKGGPALLLMQMVVSRACNLFEPVYITHRASTMFTTL